MDLHKCGDQRGVLAPSGCYGSYYLLLVFIVLAFLTLVFIKNPSLSLS